MPMNYAVRGSLLALLVALSVGPAVADPDIGCGLGTQIWTGSKGVMPKVLGATTNGTSGSQTFGITSGTIGCRQGGTVTADAKVQIFTGANLDRLAREMAQGGGETLVAFATLLCIRPEDKPIFFRMTLARFADLFAGDAVTAGAMLEALEYAMASDERFAAYQRQG
jgi:hypothetical protein